MGRSVRKQDNKVATKDDQLTRHMSVVLNESALSMAVATEKRREVVPGNAEVPFMDELQSAHEVSRKQVCELSSGDMTSLISRLNGQLQLLETAFATWASKAMTAQNVDMATKLMNTAMRIQSNMRMTAQTICDIKHPRQQVNFVRADQANLATNQQVNS